MSKSLQDVPQEIREHFGSERTSATLAAINKKAGIEILNAIPQILFSLEIKRLSIYEFIDAIAEELHLNKAKAESLAKEIKEKIFEPIRGELSSWGIDISVLNVHNARTLEESFDVKKIEAVIPLETLNDDASTEEKNLPLEKTEEPRIKTKVSEPLILHEEKSPAFAEKSKPAIKFSSPFGFFRSKPTAEEKPAVRAKIEIPGEITDAPTSGKFFSATPKSDAKRVVHYSEFRTPVSPFDGKSGEIINLEKIGEINANETKPNEKETAGKVRLEKNIIDLRASNA
ncbi:MAG: hypothetical protein AAB935_01980 [Patescibacteria group bacterium]